MATTRRLGQRPVTFGCALRLWRSREGRHLQQLLAGLRGPHDLHQLVPILCLQGAALKPFQQGMAIVGAEGRLVESFQQALFPHALHPYTRQDASRVEAD